MRTRYNMSFRESKQATSVDFFFGGEPFGLPREQWPLSKSNRQPMQFICQLPFGPDKFPGTAESVAYIFMSVGEDEEATWDPDSGENAVVIVPRNQTTGSVTHGEAPRLCRYVKKWWRSRLSSEVCVYATGLEIAQDPEFLSRDVLMNLSEDQIEQYYAKIEGNKVGGVPRFIQDDELPFSEAWSLLMQLDSTTVPFYINFGDCGIGYVFLNHDGSQAKFLWQCH